MRSSAPKVLLIAPQPFYLDRGTPMNVKLLAQVLGDAGYRIDLLVFPGGSDVSLPNVHVIRLPNIFRIRTIPAGPSRSKLAFDFLMCFFAFPLCLCRRYDVIHGVEEGGLLAVVLGRLFQRARVFDMDSSMSEHLKYSGFVRSRRLLLLARRIEAWAIAHSTMVLTMCSALTETATRLAPKAHIVQIEDIPPPDTAVPDPEMTGELQNEFQLRDVQVVLYTGNLEAYQGIDLLLQAWTLVLQKRKGSNPPVLILLGGPEEKVEYYRKKAAEFGLDSSVELIGPRPLYEMSSWMKLSHVLVSPRIKGENTPLKIYSYMASGRPVVATRCKTHTQVLSDQTAFLSDPDPLHFGQTILEALNNTRQAEERAARARILVEQKYNYDVFKSKLLVAYSQLLDDISVTGVQRL